MNPSDANSPLATLRQLKEMLDAGTLTPQEFEELKQKLVFGKATPTEGTELAALPAAFVPPMSVSEALTSAPVLPIEDNLPPTPPETPNWMAAATPASVEDTPNAFADDDDDSDLRNNQRNPLNLVFAIGGALVFLAVVLYLTLGNRAADEHLTSTTQTAADSTAITPEIGPQTQQLTLPPAAPETVRVAPTAPPVAAPTATKFSTSTDSAKATMPAPASTTPAAAPAKPVPAKPVAADTAI